MLWKVRRGIGSASLLEVLNRNRVPGLEIPSARASQGAMELLGVEQNPQHDFEVRRRLFVCNHVALPVYIATDAILEEAKTSQYFHCNFICNIFPFGDVNVPPLEIMKHYPLSRQISNQVMIAQKQFQTARDSVGLCTRTTKTRS